jgi:D-alanyl-D-alanine carboxypeptidase
MKEEKKKRRIAPPGALLLCFAAIAGIWAVDFVCRCVSVPSEESIVDEGNFKNGNNTAVTMEEASQSSDSSGELYIQDAEASISTIGTEDTVPEGCVTVPQDETAVHNGMLVQLDSTHSYQGNTGNLVTFDNKNDSYRMKRLDLTVQEDVVTAMNSLGSAYQNANGSADLMVYSTTAAYAVDGSLYPDVLPDRSSGYCVDLCILNADESISKISENTWLENNAYLYGFVFSYTEADEATTGIAAAPYHLRYVGAVHAGIMHEQNLTLSEYYDFLKSHTISVPLYYTVNGTVYTVYYVPANDGTTEVPVPLNANYEISGNNSDGYIVTAEGKIGE